MNQCSLKHEADLLRADSQIYPAFAFAQSPTFNKWVKLTCADVAGLWHDARFSGHDPAVYFHLNHPIRYVYMVGTVVAMESVGDGRWHIMTLDDGSGATAEVKIERLRETGIHAERKGDTSRRAKSNHSFEDPADSDVSSSSDSTSSKVAIQRVDDRDTEHKPLLLPMISSTTTPRVSIRGYDIFLDEFMIDIGAVIKAKGTLLAWRESVQIKLERASLITTSDEEARIWEEYTEFVHRVLSQPWHLTPAALDRIRSKDHSRKQRHELENQRRVQSKRAFEAKRRKLDTKQRIYEAKLERKLQKDAEILDGNPLI